MVNIYQISGKVLFNIKFYGTINDSLPVLPGIEQDLCHEDIDLGLLYIGRPVFKTDNVMHPAHLVKQVGVDQIYVFITKILLIEW